MKLQAIQLYYNIQKYPRQTKIFKKQDKQCEMKAKLSIL